MIYPALTYRYNVPMLFASFNDEDVRNPEKREELLQRDRFIYAFQNSSYTSVYSLWDKGFSNRGKRSTGVYQSARNADADVTVIVAEDQNHGFKQEYYMRAYLEWVKKIFASL